MELIADGLLIATTLTAAIYCGVLGRRLRRLSSTEHGLGSQIAALSGAVDEAREAISAMQDRLSGLRGQSQQASERARRDLAEALDVAEQLNSASDEARRLLDGLYAADRTLRAAPSPTQADAKPPQAAPTAEASPLNAEASRADQTEVAERIAVALHDGDERAADGMPTSTAPEVAGPFLPQAVEETDYRTIAPEAEIPNPEAAASRRERDAHSRAEPTTGPSGPLDASAQSEQQSGSSTDQSPPFALSVDGQMIPCVTNGGLARSAAVAEETIVIAGPESGAEDPLADWLSARPVAASAAPAVAAPERHGDIDGGATTEAQQIEVLESASVAAGDTLHASESDDPPLDVRHGASVDAGSASIGERTGEGTTKLTVAPPLRIKRFGFAR